MKRKMLGKLSTYLWLTKSRIRLKIQEKKDTTFGENVSLGYKLGVKLGILIPIIFVMVSLFSMSNIIFNGKSKTDLPVKYSEVDTPVKYGIAQLESGNAGGINLTAVLYSPDCSKCEAVEKKLSQKFYKLRTSNKFKNKDYVMIDVKNISAQNKQKIKKIISANNTLNTINIPYVANLKPTEKGYEVTSFSDNGNWKDIDKVLEQGEILK